MSVHHHPVPPVHQTEDFGERFRDAFRLATNCGGVSGYTPLEQQYNQPNPPHYLNYSYVVITNGASLDQPTPSELGNPNFGSINEMFRMTHRYAKSRGAATGIPVFEQGPRADGQLGFLITLLSANAVDVVTVPVSAIPGKPSFGNVQGMCVGAFRYATSLGGAYSAGFPLFEEHLDTSTNVLYYGIGLLKKTYATVQIAPADLLAINAKLSPSKGIKPGHLVLITNNGVPNSNGTQILNQSSGLATIASVGTVAIEVPSGSSGGVIAMDSGQPAMATVFRMSSTAPPAVTADQVAILAPVSSSPHSGDAFPKFVLNGNGQLH